MYLLENRTSRASLSWRRCSLVIAHKLVHRVGAVKSATSVGHRATSLVSALITAVVATVVVMVVVTIIIVVVVVKLGTVDHQSFPIFELT